MDILTTPELLDRIHALLMQETGLGIDAERMHTDALYARDVLLVCDAVQDSEGPALARRFRSLQSRHGSGTSAPTDGSMPRRAAANPAGSAERRANGRRDRRRQRNPKRLAPGRERRRGPRRRADTERVPLPAPAAPERPPKAGGPRIFSSIFGQTTQPPHEDVAPDEAKAKPLRRWFAKGPGSR